MAHIQFSWTSSTSDEYPSLVYNLYECEAGDSTYTKIVENLGALEFSLLMEDRPSGTYRYYVTAYDLESTLESVPSNIVEKEYKRVPQAPKGFVGVLFYT